MKNVVLYVRVATDASPNENGLDTQEEKLRSYAQRHGYTVTHTYQDVGPGLSEDRPGLNTLMADASQQCFDTVLILNPARLFGAWSLFGEYYTALAECGVQVICVQQADSPEGGEA